MYRQLFFCPFFYGKGQKDNLIGYVRDYQNERINRISSLNVKMIDGTAITNAKK